MSPFLALGAGAAIAFLATRSARRSARATELRLLAVHLARHPGAAMPSRPRPEHGTAEAYLAEAQASLDAELRKVTGQPAPPGSVDAPEPVDRPLRLAILLIVILVGGAVVLGIALSRRPART